MQKNLVNPAAKMLQKSLLISLKFHWKMNSFVLFWVDIYWLRWTSSIQAERFWLTSADLSCKMRGHAALDNILSAWELSEWSPLLRTGRAKHLQFTITYLLFTIYKLSQLKNLLLCRAEDQFRTEDKDNVPAVEQKQDGNPNILHLYMVTVCFPGIKTEAFFCTTLSTLVKFPV